ncbi:hypothetical protein BASA62_009880 [Batrachochytrium salamandrivorans]|nr:hypothetical protein BASA62_009880 [Batrachochytrium salamandrivorans]
MCTIPEVLVHAHLVWTLRPFPCQVLPRPIRSGSRSINQAIKGIANAQLLRHPPRTQLSGDRWSQGFNPMHAETQHRVEVYVFYTIPEVLVGFGRPGHFCASPPKAGVRSISRNQAIQGSTNSHDQHATFAPLTPRPPHGEGKVG